MTHLSCLQSEIVLKLCFHWKTVSLFIIVGLGCVLILRVLKKRKKEKRISTWNFYYLLQTLSSDDSDCTLNDLQMLDAMGSRDATLLLHAEHKIVVHPKVDLTVSPGHSQYHKLFLMIIVVIMD